MHNFWMGLLAALFLLASGVDAQLITGISFLQGPTGAAAGGVLGGGSGIADRATRWVDADTVGPSDIIINSAAASNVTVASTAGNAITLAPATGVLNVTGNIEGSSFINLTSYAEVGSQVRFADNTAMPAAIVANAQVGLDTVDGRFKMRESTGDGSALLYLDSRESNFATHSTLTPTVTVLNERIRLDGTSNTVLSTLFDCSPTTDGQKVRFAAVNVDNALTVAAAGGDSFLGPAPSLTTVGDTVMVICHSAANQWEVH